MIASGANRVSASRSSTLFLIVSGCCMGMPSCWAASLTGDGVISIPRPRALSGCVSTKAMRCPISASFSSVGTAKRGVPANTSLSFALILVLQSCLPLSGLYQLLDLTLDEVALQCADVADIELPIQMVCLM